MYNPAFVLSLECNR